MISASQVMELRNQTGAGIVDAKNALEEAGGDIAQAIEVLRKKGALKAAKKSDRTTAEGVIASYIHHNKKLGSLIEVQCETDFVARTEEFIAFANDLAAQVAAMEPLYVSPEMIPPQEVEKKRAEFMEEMAEEKKPDEMKAKIIEGKLNKWYTDVCLVKQSFFKDEDRTIEELLNEKIAKIGEKMVISRFARFKM